MNRLVCVADFERRARKVLNKNARDFYLSGADDEISVKDNHGAYSRILIRPRVLRDVSVRDLSTTILGQKVSVPIGISPTAFQCLAHEDGEVGSAKAAAAIGGIFILSVFATKSYEEIAKAAPNGRNWCQFYLHKNRALTEALIRRAERAGFEAMVVTVDAQYVGNRRSSRRDPLRLPPHLRLPNATPDAAQQEINLFRLHDILDAAVTWEAVRWLKSISKLPLVIKGIQTVEDALTAVDLGVDAIFISNHGGRQIDTTVPTIELLPEIAKAVRSRNPACEIYIDGGIRRGTDIFKALAVGANMAFVGRPAIFGLAAGGADGSAKVMEILRDELDLTMALSGVASVKELESSDVEYKLQSNL